MFLKEDNHSFLFYHEVLGSGLRNIDWHGDGYGDRFGFGYGYGYRDRFGFGYGDGDWYGDGDGYGDGNCNGNGSEISF